MKNTKYRIYLSGDSYNPVTIWEQLPSGRWIAIYNENKFLINSNIISDLTPINTYMECNKKNIAKEYNTLAELISDYPEFAMS